MKRIMVLFLTLALIFALAVPALAAEPAVVLGIDLDPALLAYVLVPFGLLLIKVLLAVAAALRKGGFRPADGGFDLKRLPEYLAKDVLPYMLPLVGLALLSAVSPMVKVAFMASAAIYTAALIKAIIANAVAFLSTAVPPDAPTA